MDDLKSRFPDFDLTEEEVQKLYGDNKITILGERDHQFYDNDHVKVYTYKITEDGEEHYYDIYRNNGQRYEISNPEEIEKVAASNEDEPVVEETATDSSVERQESEVAGFSGNWEKEGAQETYYLKIAITGSADGGYQYVGEAVYGQSTADMTGRFVSEGSQAVFVDPNMEGCQVTFTKISESSMEVVEGNECRNGGLNANFTGSYQLQEQVILCKKY